VLALRQSLSRQQAYRGAVEDAPRGTAAFIEKVLGGNLWKKQKEIADAIDTHRRVAVRSCHGAGKSFITGRIAVAYLQQHPGSIVLTTAPNFTQVREVTWRNIRAAAASARAPLAGKRGHPLQTKWEVAEDWYALGVSPGKSDSGMQGFHAPDILIIIDEAAGVGEHIYEQIEGLMTGTGARVLLVGNPTSVTGTFRAAFHKQRSIWHTITISAEDTPNFTAFGVTRTDVEQGTWEAKITGLLPYPGLVDPAWAWTQIETNGADHPTVRSRVWAEWIDGSEEALIPLALIEAAENRHDLIASGDRYLGVDAARYGGDEIAVHLRQGDISVACEAWRNMDTTEAAATIINWLDRRNLGPDDFADVRVDATGVGAGLADRLREAGWPVTDVHFGSASSDKTQWQNLRHELWWQLGERFAEDRVGTLRAWDEVLMGQLADIRISYRNPLYTKPQIEPKDETKKRTGRSPDRAEAMVLAYATLPRSETGRQPLDPSAFAIGGSASGWFSR
jgi:hypothetical protein